MTKADREAALVFLSKYGRNTQFLNNGMTGMGFLMMAVLYWMEVPVPVAVFFGLFIIGILMLVGWMVRKVVNDMRVDIEKGKKLIVAGVLMGKRNYHKDERTKTSDFKNLASFRRTGDGIWNISGRDVHVPHEFFGQEDIGQEVVLHVLPTTRIPFKVEQGPLLP